jgi:putative ABC transport system ATP-binding protein
MSSILQAKKIKKTFTEGRETEVLKGISLDIEEGEFVAVLGESGSGKSTLLYCLAGIEKPSSGEVLFFERAEGNEKSHSLAHIKDEELARLRRTEFSFVYQYDNLVPFLTAYENITLPLVLGKVKEKDYKDKAKELARYLGIEDRLQNLPKQLSGGEQQRVAVARALMTNPKLIFLDEPTGSLDKQRGIDVMELLKKINEELKVALLMVTHSGTHSKYASRIINIQDGLITD